MTPSSVAAFQTATAWLSRLSFGLSGEGHVRACYATSYEGLEEALRRIGAFVARHQA